MALRRMRGLLAAGTLALALVAGAGSGGSLSDTIDENGAYVIVADAAAKGAAVGSLGGGVSVGEGQVVSVKSEISSGSATLRLTDDAGDTVLEKTYDGPAEDVFRPGQDDFSFVLTVDKDWTTGTVTVAVADEATTSGDGTQGRSDS